MQVNETFISSKKYWKKLPLSSFIQFFNNFFFWKWARKKVLSSTDERSFVPKLHHWQKIAVQIRHWMVLRFSNIRRPFSQQNL